MLLAPAVWLWFVGMLGPGRLYRAAGLYSSMYFGAVFSGDDQRRVLQPQVMSAQTSEIPVFDRDAIVVDIHYLSKSEEL
jgi:hypothetical protein